MTTPSIGFTDIQYTSTLTARTEATAYPASNLTLRKLQPAYRSFDRAVTLDGSTEYATSTSTDFDFTGAFAVDTVFEVVATTGSDQTICSKYNTTGPDGSFSLIVKNDLRIKLLLNGTTNQATITLTGTPLTATQWYHLKVVYLASQDVTFYLDGVLVASCDNATQTGCTLVGTIDASLDTTTDPFRVGTTGAGAGVSRFGNVNIAFLSMVAGANRDQNTYLDFTTTQDSSLICYYNFDADDLTDISGNGNDLTGVNIGAADFGDNTAWQWFKFKQVSSYQPTFVHIDRHHNLQTGATIRLWGRSPTGTNDAELLDTDTATAGEAYTIIISTPTARDQFWLEIDNQDNPDGYISIPFVFIGTLTDLDHSWINDARWSNQANILTRETDGGARFGIQTTIGELWRLSALFEPVDTSDQTTIESAIQFGKRGTVPVVLKDDEGIYRTVYILQELIGYVQDSVTFTNYPQLTFEEIGGGI